MERVLQKQPTNQSMDCCKMIAAVFVLFMHVPFPGRAGEIVTCLARFAVPFFFAVSGYFCFSTGEKQIARRLVHILKLNVVAIGISLAYDCTMAVYWGSSPLAALLESLPDRNELGQWLFLHRNPFGGHLWYLTAIAFCYGCLYVYVRFFREKALSYQPLYVVSFVLFLIRFALADLTRIAGISLPYYLFRDGLFLGLPMFTLGLFLREQENRIWETFHLTSGKLLSLLLLGIGLSLFQWMTVGTGELPLGAVLQVMVLILLLSAHPTLCASGLGKNVLSQFRAMSTNVYLIHLCVNNAYAVFCQDVFSAALGGLEIWLRPWLVLGGSMLLSLAFQLLLQCLKDRRNVS